MLQIQPRNSAASIGRRPKNLSSPFMHSMFHKYDVISIFLNLEFLSLTFPRVILYPELEFFILNSAESLKVDLSPFPVFSAITE